MTKHVRSGYITPKDLLYRESSLCDYCRTWLEQAELLLNVTRLNYATSFLPWSAWIASLVSLQHQMEERSQLLCSTAKLATSPTHVRKMSYSSAFATCSQLFEVKNESETPTFVLVVRRAIRTTAGLRSEPPSSSGSSPSDATWPNVDYEAQRGKIALQGY